MLNGACGVMIRFCGNYGIVGFQFLFIGSDLSRTCLKKSGFYSPDSGKGYILSLLF